MLVDSGPHVGPVQAELIASAVAVANASNIVVAVLGDSATTCGEGADRISLDLPGMQIKVLAALVALHMRILLRFHHPLGENM